MCGIAGRYNYHSIDNHDGWADRVKETLAHRGPDSSGVFSSSKCQFIHTRLSIIDLSNNASQPMSNDDKTIYVVFNGEIYNYQDLKKDLIKMGYSFFSDSDTEVLIYLYDLYGSEMLNKIQGIFSFAIYNTKSKEIFIARDKFGVKPLYYSIVGDNLFFSSEIKGLLCNDLIKVHIDKQSIYDFMGLGYIPETDTGFDKIFALEKGHFIMGCYDGFVIKKYYSVSDTINSYDSDDLNLYDDVRSKIISSVNNQSYSDVEIGLSLSGGIDSSIIASSINSAHSNVINAYTVSFNDKDYDESKLSKLISNQLNLNHQILNIEDSSIGPDLIQKLLLHFDQPFADTSMFPTYFLYKAMQNRGIKCVLSGDGGDEVFGGYLRFSRLNLINVIMRMPTILIKILYHLGNSTVKVTNDFGRQLLKLAEMSMNGKKDFKYVLSSFSNFLNETEKSELFLENNYSPFYKTYSNNYDIKNMHIDKLSEVMSSELFDNYLPSRMLKKVDMMSMLSGVEVRVPLLDEQIINSVIGIKHSLKSDGRKTKLLLRNISKGIFPRQVYSAPKSGFNIPMDKIVDKNFFEFFEQTVMSPNSKTSVFLNKKMIHYYYELFKKNRIGKSSSSIISRGGVYQRIFNLLSLELWMRKNRLNW